MCKRLPKPCIQWVILSMEHPEALAASSLAAMTKTAFSKQKAWASKGVPCDCQPCTKVSSSCWAISASSEVKKRSATKTQVLMLAYNSAALAMSSATSNT